MFFRKDDSHEFKPILAEIEESPTNPLGRLIFWVIILIIIFIGLWSFFGMVDVVVTARGKVSPDGNIKILQPLETGVIKSLSVKEGDFVKKGQVLAEIDSSTTQPEMESIKKNLEHLELEKGRLSATSGGTPFAATLPTLVVPDMSTENVNTQRDLYQADIASQSRQIESKQQELSTIEEQIKSNHAAMTHYQTLLNVAMDKERRLTAVADIIAKNDLVQAQEEVFNYSNKVNELKYKIQELNFSKKQVKENVAYLRAKFRADNLRELSDRQKQITQLKANMEEITFRNTKTKIIAPVDGFVNTLFIHTVGGVVTPAEKLMSIVPVDSPLIIKATVLNKDIGYIRETMPVTIKIDTFDFQKYGTLKGTVKHIPKDAIEDEKLGPVYEVFIEPKDKTLKVDGKTVSIQSGMSLSVEIKVGKRRIIEFFIYPLIKYLDESISVR